MTTLVTGATGFIGAAVARRLIADGHAVRVLVRDGTDRRNIAGLDVDIALGDLADRESLARAVRGCEAVFHLAADYRIWCPRPANMYRINVDGTRDLMRAAGDAGVGRIVYTSSVAALATAGPDGPADEESPTSLDDMIGPYKRSKYLAEDTVRSMVTTDGLPAVIVNPSTPIGPRDIKPTPTGRLVVDAAAGRMPAYVDTGLNVVHVDDVADGHVLAFEKGEVGRRYILGGDDMTLRAILEEVAALVGRAPPKVRLPHAAVMPFAYVGELVARVTGVEPKATVDGVRMARKLMYFSSARARDELGYRPRAGTQALADAVGWFKANGYV